MKGNKAMRPQPIAEIVVTQLYPGFPHLELFAATPDADSWIRDNVPEFGILSMPEDSVWHNSFSLHIDSNYDVSEVAEYIRSVGKDNTDDPATLVPTTEPGVDNE